MNFFKSKLLTLVLVLCLVFTIFIGTTSNNKGNVGSVQNVITSIVSPIQKFTYTAGQRVADIFRYIKSLSELKNENENLTTKINELNQKLVDYDRLKRENDEMNKLLGFKNSRSDLKFVGANVIGKVGDNWFDAIIIDIGEDDGVKKGQYVISGNGLVGQVIETAKTTSKVMTILDDKINIPAKVSSTGEDGIVNGAGEGMDKKCKINYLANDTKTKPGDAVVTSNIISDDNIIIPSNILIGFVEKVEDDKPNLVKTAYVKPVVDFSTLEKVMLIIR